MTLLEIPVILGFSIEVYFILLIISIPTFHIWKWLLKKFIKVEITRIIVTWATTIITTPLIYSGFIMLFMFWWSYTPSIEFNKSKWLSNTEDRYQMADNIINSKMLIGKDTNQVKQFLGPQILRNDSLNMWSYNMGFGGGGIGFLFHNLDLKFDKNGKVISVEHIEIRD